jgi:hypothetical protein
MMLLGALAPWGARADESVLNASGEPSAQPVSFVDAEPREEFFVLTGAVPPGFEHLAGPQQALVDVYYGEWPIHSTMAVIEPGSIRFEFPEEIVTRLPDILVQDAVLAALQGDLPTNAQALCSPDGGSSACGKLEPEIAAVIFDESRFRVDLFVNPRLRMLREPDLDRYLPPSQSELSYLQTLSLTAAGSDASSDVMSFSSFSTLAWRENRLVGVASYTDQDEATLDSFFGQRDFRGNQHIAGLYRTSGQVAGFSGDYDLVGYRIATSLLTRADLALARGTPIEVFLLAPARIDILKDGRLLSTNTYGAGNQKLDTSNLPEGAYDVELRINEGGRVREETRFFSKTSRIPPRDQALRTLEVGRVVNINNDGLLPEDMNAWFSRVGYSSRLTDTFGYDLGFTSTEDEQLYEFGLFQIDTLPGGWGGYYEVQASTFLSHDQDTGFAFNGRVLRGDFTASLDYRKIHNDEPRDFARLDPDEFMLIPADREEYTAMVRMPVGSGTLSFSATLTKRADMDAIDSQSVNLRYPLRMRGQNFLEFTADVGRRDGEYAALFGMRVNLWRGPWNVEVAPRVQTTSSGLDAGDDGLQVDSYVSYTQRDTRIGDVQASMRGAAGAAEDRLSGRLQVDNVIGRADFQVERFQNSGGQNINAWSGSMTTSVLTNGDAWTLGAQNSAQSAVVIDLEGERTGVTFEVLINGHRRGYAPAGEATAILLAPFQTYDVRIRPVAGEFVSFDDRIERVTLYPGNVERLSWQVGQLLVVIGKVVDLKTGEPFSDAELENTYGLAARTDASGYFQAEVKTTGEDVLRLNFRRGDKRCTAAVSEYLEVSGVAMLDTVGCRMR